MAHGTLACCLADKSFFDNQRRRRRVTGKTFGLSLKKQPQLNNTCFQMKIIAYYLPQFHQIPENDQWWGEGFTEWVNVRKAVPLFNGHNQPRKPLDDNYYDLTNVDVLKWQTNLAKEYGIYGFCFYHYWFDGKLLLERPVELFLKSKDINFPFCICWANEEWTNRWISGKSDVLIKQRYGDLNEWKDHFYYLLPFLKDKRYIQKDGKPVVIIYRPDLITKKNEMLKYWGEMAIKEGLKGICFMSQRADGFLDGNSSDLSMFDYNIEYQPGIAFRTVYASSNSFIKLRLIKRRLVMLIEKKLHIPREKFALKKNHNGVSIRDYDRLWGWIINQRPLFNNSIPGAFVGWDNTPRTGENGSVVVGSSPKKFEYYLSEQIKRAKTVYNQDMIFLFAWNEWAEGGFLEPDETYGYGFLNAVKNALMLNGCFISDCDKG